MQFDIKIPDMVPPSEAKDFTYLNSDLMDIGNHGHNILTDLQYPKLGMKHAIKQCLMRREVFDLLLRVQKQLPKGYNLKIYDAWRPFSLQQELYGFYYDEIVKHFRLENSPRDEQVKIVKNYVSIPVKDDHKYPVHVSGGAVDLTIVGPDGLELDMGTKFDDMTIRSETSYFEHHEDNNVVRNNRRMLYQAMTQVGFTNLPSEWWHYDYGDRFWAYYTKSPVLYAPVYEKGE